MSRLFSLGKLVPNTLRIIGSGSKFVSKLSPAKRILASYVLLIMVGAFLLWSSLSQAQVTSPVSFLDALFISASAICVTGLTTIDITTQFSIYGQLILLILIQIGGLGFMALSAGLILSFGGRSSMLNRLAIAETFSLKGEHAMRDLMRSVLLATFGIELIGTLFLLIDFWVLHEMNFGKALWFAFFHSISAFCNAGFSLFSKSLHGADSLVNFVQDPLLNFTIMALIVLGGIGFFVIKDMWEWLCNPARHRLALQSKIVSSTSFILISAGAIGLYIFEKDMLFSNSNVQSTILPCVFQSVSARTAGFNTIDLGSLSSPALFLLIIWMFIGGSPASCAGGIKTTTAFVLFSLVWARLHQYRNPKAFGRQINDETVAKAATLTLASMVFVSIMFAVLLMIESSDRYGVSRGGKFLDMLFETVSAFGTVGLSVGITPTLHPGSKLVLIFCMFVGRVGMFSAFVALSRRPRADKVRYPEESLMVG